MTPPKFRWFAVLALGALLAAPSLHAQLSRASLLGQVTDSTNAGIPLATVEITRTDTNETLTTTTDATARANLACTV